MGMNRMHPPMAPLRAVLERLQAAGVTASLGGSGLLYAHGIVERVNDWDLITDHAPDEVEPALHGVQWRDLTTPDYATACRFSIRLDGVEVDLISRFAIPVEGQVCRFPSTPAGQWQGIPLSGLEVWAAAYWLMGRTEKAALVLEHLRQQGADPARLERMLREPLPAALRGELEGLR